MASGIGEPITIGSYTDIGEIKLHGPKAKFTSPNTNLKSTLVYNPMDQAL